mmetsp:Transcript_2835/g.4780  ORF Transcript_2835/g.4780 Transcript_2835/m.4780 type:complete len:465 (-) Transcript_2835:68-1462(-)
MSRTSVRTPAECCTSFSARGTTGNALPSLRSLRPKSVRGCPHAQAALASRSRVSRNSQLNATVDGRGRFKLREKVRQEVRAVHHSPSRRGSKYNGREQNEGRSAAFHPPAVSSFMDSLTNEVLVAEQTIDTLLISSLPTPMRSLHNASGKASVPVRARELGSSTDGYFELDEGRPLGELCTWRIGGPAKYSTDVRDLKTLRAVARFAKEKGLRMLVLGKGSNVLFDDRGFDGIVVVNKICFVEDLEDGLFRVGGGMRFDQLGWVTSRKCYSGLEFATGIPGTVGGAVYMNAGANGQSTVDALQSVEYLTKDGELKELRRDHGDLHTFSYRHTPFQGMSDLACITAATFQLAFDADASQTAKQMSDRRKASQPLSKHTAGCVFRNPGGVPAGMLIDQAGLKGSMVGGAAVSDHHANFFINDKGMGTTAAEMRQLIQNVKEKIFAETGHVLQEEVQRIPYSCPDET